MLTARSDNELVTDELAAIEEGKQAQQPVVCALSLHVTKSFEDAKMFRETVGISNRLLKSRRLKAGKYSPEQAAAIALKGGTQLFFNVTEQKCEAAEAWLTDVLTPTDDRSWDIRPTPIPTLPGDMGEAILQAAVQQFAHLEAFTPEDIDARGLMVQEYATQMYDEMLKQLSEEAQEINDRMSQKMADQTIEGGWAEAVGEFVNDLVTYPTAILKGPVMVQKKVLAYENGEPVVKEEIVPTWKCVDPMNFYPGPNARNVEESYLCEILYIDKANLSLMRGVPGWNVDAINAVLSMNQQSITNPPDQDLSIHTEKATLEDRDDIYNNGIAVGSVSAVEFWGNVPGWMLKQWGSKEAIADDFAYYPVQCIKVGNLVLLAKLNADPLSRRPYFADSFVRNKNSIWGLASIPEKMEDCQDGVNGTQRALMNNQALASGPMQAVDLDAILPQYIPTINNIAPWKVIGYSSSKSGGRDPVKWFQPKSNSAELINTSDWYEKKADDRTLIPSYVTGDQDIGGAGQTASGLSMLMGAASRGIKRVIKSTDKYVTRPAIERLYNQNMLDPNIDKNCKGDAQVIARGALALLVKEQTQLRRQEFLALTNNPTDLAIIGVEGRATVLREVAKALDIPVDKVVPSEEALRQQHNAEMQRQGVGPDGQPLTPDQPKPQQEAAQ